MLVSALTLIEDILGRVEKPRFKAYRNRVVESE